MAESPDSGGFLARWGRRKTQARAGEVLADAPLVVAAPVLPPVLPPALPLETVVRPPQVQALAPEVPPPPTLADVALLTRESDYARFVASGVDEGVKRAAMKKLFSDPHFNVMDGLDIYIDDYTQADPIPLAMLREMNQSKALKLFEEVDEKASAGASDLSLEMPGPVATLEVPLEPTDSTAPAAVSDVAQATYLVDAASPANAAEAEANAPEPKRAL